MHNIVFVQISYITCSERDVIRRTIMYEKDVTNV